MRSLVPTLAIATAVVAVVGGVAGGPHRTATTAAPITETSPTPGPLYKQPYDAKNSLSLDPTTSTPFVPTGVTGPDLVEAGIVFTPAQNLNPPVGTYSQALQDLNTCDAFATQVLANAGYTHVTLQYQTDRGTPYAADVWAFATLPESYPDAEWTFWFIDANDGTCRGASGGAASSDPAMLQHHFPDPTVPSAPCPAPTRCPSFQAAPRPTP